MSSSAQRPVALLDALNYPVNTSWGAVAFQGDVDGGSNLVYIGFARPGSSTSAAVWQIRKVTYNGSTPIAIQWPQNASGNASNDYEFSWSGRAGYTYS